MKKQSPGSASPTPFMYRDFQEAYNNLNAALLKGEAYSLLLGESGTGKTTLLRTLHSRLDRRRFHILYLCHGQPSPSGLGRVLAEALHLPIRRTRAETSRLLVQTLRNLPTRLLFWIDEAQMNRDDTLHELRLLSEADLEGPPLFSVVLSALPELKDRLLAPHLFPLWRRIATRVTLTGVQREELVPFLSHVLSPREVERFSEDALAILFEQGRGIPALIGTLAGQCLKASPKEKLTVETVSAILEHLAAA
jgi:type II secretory pathway predicted ATPase ExeA